VRAPRLWIRTALLSSAWYSCPLEGASRLMPSA
jgi:hypothetical protein